MNTKETVFRYFCNPHQFSTYSDEAQTCDLCGESRSGYKGPFYGRTRVGFACEQCLASGKLADIKATTNEGHFGALRAQLQELHPDLDKAQIGALAQQRTAELEHRTPHLVTWQSFLWPAHCGDYCCFVKEVGKPDLNELAPDGDGQAFFGSHLYGRLADSTDASAVWKGIRPDSPNDNSVAYDIGVYFFQCLHCGAHVILWDCS